MRRRQNAFERAINYMLFQVEENRLLCDVKNLQEDGEPQEIQSSDTYSLRRPDRMQFIQCCCCNCVPRNRIFSVVCSIESICEVNNLAINKLHPFLSSGFSSCFYIITNSGHSRSKWVIIESKHKQTRFFEDDYATLSFTSSATVELQFEEE